MAVFVIGARTPEGFDFMFEKYRTSLQMALKSRLKVAMSVSPLQDKLMWCVRTVSTTKISISLSFSPFLTLFPFVFCAG